MLSRGVHSMRLSSTPVAPATEPGSRFFSAAGRKAAGPRIKSGATNWGIRRG